MTSYIDKEKTKKTIALVLDKIGKEADPWLLGEYLSLFKKEVSVFHRSKVAAYLLMLCEQGGNCASLMRRPSVEVQDKSLRSVKQGDLSQRNKNTGTDKAVQRKTGSNGPLIEEDPQRHLLAEEDSKRLFFSVGRSRRVFPREILGLINSKTAIPKEDIGSIRILDNYSFVQVRDTVAEKIIEALNGLNFRGRPLTVNYAKSRRDEDNSAENDEYVSEEGTSSPEAALYDDSPISEQDHPKEENI
jgi:hypothetical protein